MLRWTRIVFTTVLASAVVAPSAAAHVSPSGCTGDSSHVNFTGGETWKQNGDVLPFTISVGNNGGAPNCDISNGTVTIQFPNPDGTPGQVVTVAQNLNLPLGTAYFNLPTVNYTANLNNDVIRALVTVTFSYTWHGTDADITTSGGTSRYIYIDHPHVALSVAPDSPTGPAPHQVTYTYTAQNDSTVNPYSAYQSDVVQPAITDDQCSPVVYSAGDTDVDGLLDQGETWTYTCTHTFGGGVYTNHVSFAGFDAQQGEAWPQTTAQSTVTSQAPNPTVVKSHTGDFTQADTGRAYTIVVTNSGDEPTAGAVSFTDALPAGLKATGIAGDGWSCDLASLTCSRSDVLAAGAAYPPVTLTVDVAGDAPGSVVNTVTVQGGGESGNGLGDDTARDPTTIEALPTSSGSGANPLTPAAVPAGTCKLTAVNRQRLLSSKGRLVAKLSCTRATIGKVSARMGRAVLGAASVKATAGRTATVSIHVSKKALKKLLAALKRKPKTRVTLTFAGMDDLGNAVSASVTVTKLRAR